MTISRYAPALLFVLGLATPGPAVESPAKKVKDSIENAKRYLREQENGKGNFEQAPGLEGLTKMRRGGVTALAGVALLNAGVPANDPLMQRCLKYLRTLQPKDSYTVGLQTMAFCLAGYKQDRELVQRNLDWIVKLRMRGGWPYTAGDDMKSFGPDHSINFFILLGVDEAARTGFQIDKKMLKAMRDYYAANRSGQWTYRNTNRSRLNMTASGLSSLLITERVLQAGKGRQRDVARAALMYLGDTLPADISKERKEGGFLCPFSCLHAVKHAGRLTGQRSFGQHDWYRIGCEYLVASQKLNGSWEGTERDLDRWPVVATSFALIFLAEPAKK